MRLSVLRPPGTQQSIHVKYSASYYQVPSPSGRRRRHSILKQGELKNVLIDPFQPAGKDGQYGNTSTTTKAVCCFYNTAVLSKQFYSLLILSVWFQLLAKCMIFLHAGVCFCGAHDPLTLGATRSQQPIPPTPPKVECPSLNVESSHSETHWWSDIRPANKRGPLKYSQYTAHFGSTRQELSPSFMGAVVVVEWYHINCCFYL